MVDLTLKTIEEITRLQIKRVNQNTRKSNLLKLLDDKCPEVKDIKVLLEELHNPKDLWDSLGIRRAA